MSRSHSKSNCHGASERSPQSKNEFHVSERKRNHRHVSRKSRSHHHNGTDKLRKIANRVHHMVEDDRKQMIDNLNTERVPLDSVCGCPFNCAPELEKLREYIDRLSPILSETKGASPKSLQSYTSSPGALLWEVWNAIGPLHMRELIPDSLLAICSRREKRGNKHTSSYVRDHTQPRIEPPFVTFDPKDQSPVPSPGLLDLWNRCLYELHELSTEQVTAVLSGSDHQLPLPFPLDSSDQVDPNGSRIKPPDSHEESGTLTPAPAADSTSQLFTPEGDLSSKPEMFSSPASKSLEAALWLDEPENRFDKESLNDSESNPDHDSTKTRTCLEITELEMRARLLRSMLVSKVNSTSKKPV